MATTEPHLFLATSDGDGDPCFDECVICGLPDLHANHNARPVRTNARSRRVEYVNPVTGARSSYIPIERKASA